MRAGATRGAGASRTVSDGSSASTEPMPTPIASLPARIACTTRRDSSPVIQREWPVASASAPSSESASLSVIHGRLLGERVEEWRVELARLALDDAGRDLDASRTQQLGAAARRSDSDRAPR